MAENHFLELLPRVAEMAKGRFRRKEFMQGKIVRFASLENYPWLQELLKTFNTAYLHPDLGFAHDYALFMARFHLSHINIKIADLVGRSPQWWEVQSCDCIIVLLRRIEVSLGIERCISLALAVGKPVIVIGLSGLGCGFFAGYEDEELPDLDYLRPREMAPSLTSQSSFIEEVSTPAQLTEEDMEGPEQRRRPQPTWRLQLKKRRSREAARD